MQDTDRLERLLALLLLAQLKGSTQREKIHQLNLAGLSNVEIANILGITTAGVAQGLYEAKSGKGRKKASSASSSKRASKP
jgi:DNA-directed RNA polymerase specialized sigma24 family protein